MATEEPNGTLRLSAQATSSINAVRADRTLTFVSSSAHVLLSATTQNLIADRSWTLGIVSGSLLGTSNQVIVTGNGFLLGNNLTLTLPQDIGTSSVMTLGGLIVSGTVAISGSGVTITGPLNQSGSVSITGTTNITPLTVISPGITSTGLIFNFSNGAGVQRLTLNGSGRLMVSGSLDVTGSVGITDVVNLNQISISGSVIRTTSSNRNLVLQPHGSGHVRISGSGEMMVFQGDTLLDSLDA